MEYIPIRTKACVSQLKHVLDLEGDVIEMGVYTGKTTFQLAKLLKDNNSNKIVYAFDTFEGMPEYDIESSIEKGKFYYGIEEFIKQRDSRKLENYVVPVVGNIKLTTMKLNKKSKFCFAWLDMDTYTATEIGFNFVNDRLVKGGIIGFHDYDFHDCPGIKRFVDSKINKNKYRELGNIGYCIFFEKL